MQLRHYEDVFDGAMIVLAMYTLNVLHPGWLLKPDDVSSFGYQHTEVKLDGSGITLLPPNSQSEA